MTTAITAATPAKKSKGAAAPSAPATLEALVVDKPAKGHTTLVNEQGAKFLQAQLVAAGYTKIKSLEVMADLAASGLTATTIAANGYTELQGHTLGSALGYLQPDGTPKYMPGSGLFIPYRELDGSAQPDGKGAGLFRLRLYGAALDVERKENGKAPKYKSAFGSESGIYFPAELLALAAAGTTIDCVFVTEGEKKAALLSQLGVPCIGISGVYNWVNPGARAEEKMAGQDAGKKAKVSPKTPLHPTLMAALTTLGVSRVVVLSDSDAKSNDEVMSAMRTLSNAIRMQMGLSAGHRICPILADHLGQKAKTGADDWAVRAGSIAIVGQLNKWAAATTDACEVVGGYTPLGYIGSTSVVWSHAREYIEMVKPNELNENHLKMLCGASYVTANYGYEDENGKIHDNINALKQELLDGCQAAGIYDSRKVHGAGCFVSKDDKDVLVVNSRELFRTDSQPVSRVADGVVYAAGTSLGLESTTPAATDEEVMKFIETLKLWNWRTASDRALFAGWHVVGTLTGSLAYLPHLFITGTSGGGKSGLMNLSHSILGGSCRKYLANSTAAGIRQNMGAVAGALILDEFEGKNGAALHQQEQIMELTRMSFSDSTGDGTARGGADGNARNYTVKFAGMFAGIVPPPMEAADRKRFAVLHLNALKLGAPDPELLTNPEAARELGARLRMRAIKNWPHIRASLQVLKPLLVAKGYTGRLADTLGTLLACYYVLVKAGTLTAEGAERMLTTLDLSHHIQAVENASDERDCMDHLLGSRARLDDAGTTRDMSIAEAISKVRVAGKGSDVKALVRSLELYGIKVSADGQYVQIATAKSIQGLRELYQESKFSNGGWATVLARVPKAKVDGCTPKMGGQTVRCVGVPMSFALPDGLEDVSGQQALGLDDDGIEAGL